MPEERGQDLGIAAPPPSSTTPHDGFADGMFGGEVDTTDEAQKTPADDKPFAGSSNTGNKKFDPSKIDWYRTKTEELPEEWRGYQSLLKNHLAEQTRANERAAQYERELQSLKQQMTGHQENRLAQALERLAPENDPYADLRQKLEPEDVGAIDVVREIIKRELGTSLPKVEPVQQEVNQLKQVIAGLLQHFQNQQVQSASEELRQAREKHGDRLEAIAPNIRALIQTVNPNTGRAFTVTEAADLLLSNSTVDQARQTDRQIRSQAKRQAAGGSGVTAGNSNGTLSDQEVLAELAALGFKR